MSRPTGRPPRSCGSSDVLARQDDAIRLLDGALTRLREVQQAKAALRGLSAAELRAALQLRRAALGSEPA